MIRDYEINGVTYICDTLGEKKVGQVGFVHLAGIKPKCVKLLAISGQDCYVTDLGNIDAFHFWPIVNKTEDFSKEAIKISETWLEEAKNRIDINPDQKSFYEGLMYAYKMIFEQQ